MLLIAAATIDQILFYWWTILWYPAHCLYSNLQRSSRQVIWFNIQCIACLMAALVQCLFTLHLKFYGTQFRVFFTCSVTVEYCLCDDDRNTQYYCFICLFDDLLGPKSLCVEMYQYWLLVRYGRMHDIGSWIQVSVLLALLASLFFLSFNKIIVCQRLVDQSIIPNIRSWYSNAFI